MNLRCPVCRADNTTGPACRRCKADLSLLIAVEDRRAFYLASAAQFSREGRFDDALEQLRLVDDLRPGPDVRRMRACLSVLAGDYASALSGL